MTDKSSSPTVPGKRRRWLKILGGLFALLVVLLVVAYFVGTSSGFLKGFILPRVSSAANATITVEDASISPFSQVILHNLKVQTTGTEPLVTATEVRLRYSLLDILGGKINVEEATLVSPVINLIVNADGTSNLDPLLKSFREKKPEPAKASSPPQISLKKLVLTNATVRQTKNHKDGQRDVLELANVNVTLDDVKNGATGKLTLGADVQVDNHPPSPAIAGAMHGKVSGDFVFARRIADRLPVIAARRADHARRPRAAGQQFVKVHETAAHFERAGRREVFVLHPYFGVQFEAQQRPRKLRRRRQGMVNNRRRALKLVAREF